MTAVFIRGFFDFEVVGISFPPLVVVTLERANGIVEVDTTENVKEEVVSAGKASVAEGAEVDVMGAVKERAVEIAELDPVKSELLATEGNIMESFALFKEVEVGWESGTEEASLRVGR
jgi:hypothetical protein